MKFSTFTAVSLESPKNVYSIFKSFNIMQNMYSNLAKVEKIKPKISNFHLMFGNYPSEKSHNADWSNIKTYKIPLYHKPLAPSLETRELGVYFMNFSLRVGGYVKENEYLLVMMKFNLNMLSLTNPQAMALST